MNKQAKKSCRAKMLNKSTSPCEARKLILNSSLVLVIQKERTAAGTQRGA